jgi:ribosome biogenesis protein Nip4
MPTTTKLTRLVDMDDPYCCSLCFHAYTTVSGVKAHLKQFHLLSQAQITANPDHQNPKTLGYFSNLGRNVTYQGSDPKQINARRRMAAGLNTSHQGYWNDVY